MKYIFLIASLLALIQEQSVHPHQQTNLGMLADVAALQHPQPLIISEQILHQNLPLADTQDIFERRIQSYCSARRAVLLNNEYGQETVAKLIPYDSHFCISLHRRQLNRFKPEIFLSRFIFKQPLATIFATAQSKLDMLVTKIIANKDTIPGKHGHSIALRHLAHALNEKLLGIADAAEFFTLVDRYTTPLIHLLAEADKHDGVIEKPMDLLLYFALFLLLIPSKGTQC
jgi:hypothetical protein